MDTLTKLLILQFGHPRFKTTNGFMENNDGFSLVPSALAVKHTLTIFFYAQLSSNKQILLLAYQL